MKKSVKKKSVKKRTVTKAFAAFTPNPKPEGIPVPGGISNQLPEAGHDDPVQELRSLCREHANWSKTSVALHHMINDRVARTGPRAGETILCQLPKTIRDDLDEARDRLNALDAQKGREMTRALEKIPIWQKWLSSVAGIGPIVGAQLVGNIRIDIKESLGQGSTKASALKLFCGVCPSVTTGRLVRREAGQKNRYNATLRTALFQAWVSMRRTGGKYDVCRVHDEARRAIEKKTWSDADRQRFRDETLACRDCLRVPYIYGRTCKYLEIWENTIHSTVHDPRFDPEANTWTRVKFDGSTEVLKGARAWAQKRGMWRSVDIFIEDLYTVWRALEGLPVWPDWYAVRLGYAHGGQKIDVQAPKMLTLDEARTLVEDVAWRPRGAPAPLIEDDVAAE